MGFTIKGSILIKYTEEPGVTEVVLPHGVKKIDRFAFFACHSLTSVVLPPGLKTIGTFAFSDCTRLSSILIPRSVRKIDPCAFLDCPSLPMLTFQGDPDRPFPLPAQYKSLPLDDQIAVYRLYVNSFQQGVRHIETKDRLLCTLLACGYREASFLVEVRRCQPRLLAYAIEHDDVPALRPLLTIAPITDETLEAAVARAADCGAKACFIVLVDEKQRRGLLTEDEKRL